MTSPKQADELLKLCDKIIAAEEELRARKPTIEELERMLETPESDISVSLNPDGSLNATSTVVVLARELKARLSSPSVPETHAIVPKEPTDRQVGFGHDAGILKQLPEDAIDTVIAIYKAMLAAAHPPSAPPEAGKVQEATEYWWLIESNEHGIYYATCEPNDPLGVWTSDPFKAARFPTEKAADWARIAMRLYDDVGRLHCKPVEHGFEIAALRHPSPVAQGAGVDAEISANAIVDTIARNVTESRQLSGYAWDAIRQIILISITQDLRAARHPSHPTGSDGTVSIPVDPPEAAIDHVTRLAKRHKDSPHANQYALARLVATETYRTIVEWAKSKPTATTHPTGSDGLTHATAQEQIQQCVRQIQILSEQFGYDPTEWLHDEVAQ